MEIRTVLTKKKRMEQDRVESILADIEDNLAISAPEPSDQVTAYQMQEDTLLYPMDCVLLALAEDLDADFATFDAEILDHGGVDPAELI